MSTDSAFLFIILILLGGIDVLAARHDEMFPCGCLLLSLAPSSVDPPIPHKDNSDIEEV
jgi:hypothetical protein